ncbi:MAG: hypothetical protein KJZ87_27425 [Thermoguttaceae bacterium]|nr:hypothetical protein [Thermoguttaceae bacterium]
MPVTKPFKRTVRQLVDGSYANNGNGRYVAHPQFATAPRQYIRAFDLIQKDLLELFDYIEPADVNLQCYSYRIHELHLRTCVEVEANCKAILSENRYVRADGCDLNVTDYRKLNVTHHLSSYEIRLPLWHGPTTTRAPFAAWQGPGSLPWYQAYNAAKHDRHNQFHQSNFGNLIESVSGLVALLAAQFHTEDFQPAVLGLEWGRPDGGFQTAIGGYFHVKFPKDWVDADRYGFTWSNLEQDTNPIQTLAFP